jgi:nitrite reductase/ring-hydroxylating ferredoxin subunit
LRELDMEDQEIDTFSRDTIICPWCGHEFRDPWEFDMNDGDCMDMECYECDAKFTVLCSIDISYTTERVEPKKDGDKHE